MPATPLPEVDAAIDELYARRSAWRSVPVAERAALLERCAERTLAVAEPWVEIGARLKGISPGERLAGEEWLAGPLPTIRNAKLLARALRAGGEPAPVALGTRRDGRAVARIFPATLTDRLLFAGFTADVWIERGKPPSQGAIYRRGDDGAGTVCLVLGGGNVSSIPPMDVFYKLFVEDEVVLLKMNPVNEAVGPVLAEALQPLIREGWLAIVYGGSDVGAHAASHPKIGSLHITGSNRTYDAIVWGASPEEQRANKASGQRVNTKPFSAELGCVTPVLVVPGPWSQSDIRFQARHVASMVTQNASFNCNAAKVVVVAKQWLQRDAFLGALHEELARTSARKAYYPGAQGRYQAFLARYPEARVVGSRPSDAPDDVVPWTVIPGVTTDDDYALKNEAFCGLVAEVEVDVPDHGGPSVARFLREAVKFANESCWGTLSCCLLVHPATADDHADELSRAVEELRYGSIGVNVWPGVIYALASPTWGAYPGHRPEDIQSGVGVVHNTSLFDHPEKSVVRAPFRIRPTPPWFADHPNLLEVGRRLVELEAAPSLRRFLRVVKASLKRPRGRSDSE
jgi:acyl-CoA reductase-like NAD-dependent aldehyde dehydrogenase